MTLLPIVERELRVAARRRGTYWTRSAIALGATMVGILTFLASLVNPAAKFGELLFWGLSGMSMCYCLVAGRQMTADCLSEEKREGTFGLLFLTDLKGYDVVLGKLAARSFNGFYGLVATVPVLAIPLLVGGMTYGEFWRMVLVLVDTFLFTLAVGIFASAVSRDYQHAMGRNFALLLVTTAVLPALATALLVWQPAKPLRAELLFPCPVFTFVLCSDAFYTKMPLQFWLSAAVVHCMTWILIVLACRIAPHSWQDKPLPSRSEALRQGQSWQWWREGAAEKREAFRRELLAQNAYYWLAGRPHVKAGWVWMLLALMGCWLVRTAVAVGRLDEMVCLTAAVLLNSTLKIWIALEASQQLAADQKSGAFELLLSTPLTVREILRGQLLALARQFLKPLLTVVVMEFIFVVLLVSHSGHGSDAQVVWTATAGIGMLAADAAALSVVGMAAGLTAKSHAQASMRAVRSILVLPWLLYGIVLLTAALCLEWWPDWKARLSWEYALATWFGLGIGVDVVFGWRAWHQLRTDFRELASHAFSPPGSRFSGSWRRWTQAVSQAVEMQPNPEAKQRARRKFNGPRILGAAVVVCVCLFLINRVASSRSPKPVVVALGRTNTIFRAVRAQDGMLFVLPDGSLWRWGKMDGDHLPRAASPQRVGTNSDWVEAFSSGSYTIGLRRNGTVWEWDADRSEPRQVAPGHDWVQVSGGADYSVLLRRDGTLWGWGENSAGQLGNRLGRSPAGKFMPQFNTKIVQIRIDTKIVEIGSDTKIVQIGTNADWKTVGSRGYGAIALRQNGTLWVWGNVGLLSGLSFSTTNYPLPTQACRETNWISISPGYPAVARNQEGELWSTELSYVPPSPAASASLVFVQSGRSSTAAEPAVFLVGGPSPSGIRYEVHSNGTLWEIGCTWWPGANPAPQKWVQFGKRHDWTWVWGDGMTAVALTADGTLWTWGNDWGHDPSPPFQSKLQTLRERVARLLGAPSSGNQGWKEYPVQKEPKPLMRLLAGKSGQTNSAPR